MADLSDLEIKSITQYVESQTHDRENGVRLVQKVGSRRIAGNTHELFDVWMEKDDRWWVITDPLNLYAQEDFNSIEQAFTYHLGLGMILLHRGTGEAVETEDDDPGMRPAWRKFTKAAEAMSEASESEDFQAVGIRCREALIALVKAHTDDSWVVRPADPPKAADVKGWTGIFAESLATGRLRRYLRDMADKTWDLTVWLQHYSDATEWDAELVLHATAHCIRTFTLAMIRAERGEPSRCPECESYRVTTDGDVEERDGLLGWWSQPACPVCGWRGEVTFEPYSAEYLRRLTNYHAGRDPDDDGKPEGRL